MDCSRMNQSDRGAKVNSYTLLTTFKQGTEHPIHRDYLRCAPSLVFAPPSHREGDVLPIAPFLLVSSTFGMHILLPPSSSPYALEDVLQMCNVTQKKEVI